MRILIVSDTHRQNDNYFTVIENVGKIDMVMQRILEIVNGIPRLVIVTLLLLVLKPGMLTIIFALMLTEWVGMSRIARAEMLKLKEQEFVLASRTLGAGSFFIIFTH